MKPGEWIVRRLLLSIVVFAGVAPQLWADVKLPGFFSNHMVMQQGVPVQVWGWADEGESITVLMGEAKAETVAGPDGRWRVKLPSLQAGQKPHSLKVTGKNVVSVEDILIGEVWLCSGQSNMEWTVSRSANSEAEIAAADFPMIRHLKIAHRPSTKPLDDVQAEWTVCSPTTAGNFTGCGYFMARQLFQELNVPIGLINSSWGGTRVEPWTPINGFASVPAVADIHHSVLQRTPGFPEYETALTAHMAATRNWLNAAKEARADRIAIPLQPPFPATLKPFQSHQDPTMLYNGMIHALVGYPIRGAIWYQGESNHAEGMLYFEKKKALIQGWRERWEQGDFPFYYVQIAPFQYGNEDPTILARFWEAQATVRLLNKTGMVIINDIATLNNIHPPNKQDVGLRLANLALHNDYGKTDVVCNSPSFQSLSRTDQQLMVTFQDTAGGLRTRDKKPVSGFEVIGPGSGGYHPAKAVIAGDTVTLTSDRVGSPTAFRFAWHKLAEPNLTGGTGLPVGAVRGGEIPNFTDMLPIHDEYQLVYDLDLNRLGNEITYDQDRSSRVGQFDRIAYHLELLSPNATPQHVFVSMDAFTDDAKKIGVPTVASGARFQQSVKNLQVFSTVNDVATESTVPTGNIEFWPHNYGPANDAKVTGANNNIYDFGDSPGAPQQGYGSMQVHNTARRQTVFALNHWGTGSNADVGIGNSTGSHRDWTFSGNAGSYSQKRLRVYVRPMKNR